MIIQIRIINKLYLVDIALRAISNGTTANNALAVILRHLYIRIHFFG